MKAALGFVGFVLVVSAVSQGCTDDFEGCRENRTCTPTTEGGDDAGGAGNAGAPSQAAAGEGLGGAAGGTTTVPVGGQSIGGADAAAECEVGEVACQGQAVVQCQAGAWTQVASCPFACSGEGICAGECVPQTRDCDGTTPRQCTDAGEWQALEACPDACGGEGNCIGQCNPTSEDCLGDVPRVCDQAGEWAPQAACTYLCSGEGECVGECEPSDKKCDGNSPSECNATGEWVKQAACANVCSGKGVCGGACKPGDRDCSGTKPRECNASGEWVEEAACAFVCSGEGVCGGTCKPGTKVCSGNGYKTCSAAGAYGTVSDCPAASPLCGGAGVCGAPNSCSGLPATCGPNGNDSCCSSNVVPGGTFNRLNDAKYPATISSFRLDTYEITVGRFRKFVAAYTGKNFIALGAGKNPNNASDPGWLSVYSSQMPATAAELPIAASDNTWTAGNDNRPLNWLDWYRAYAFCIWDGGRLPTEAEWDYAAVGGSQQRVFPWAGGTIPGPDALLAVHGCYFNGNGSCTGATNIAPVGSVAAGNARWGQADLVGNLSEWTIDDWENPSTPCSNCSQVKLNAVAGEQKTLRGSSFSGLAQSNPFRVSAAAWGNMGSRVHGARCARSQ